jgi:hypothetical protein
MEFILKDYLKKANNKDVMNLNLWGQVKDNNECIFNMMRLLHNKQVRLSSVSVTKRLANEETPSSTSLFLLL